MSCIRFTTPAQLAQLRAAAPAMLTSEQVAALHPAPEITESKLRRLRLMATDTNPRIRESVASGRHTPADVLARLATDPDAGVRACVARNETVQPDVLQSLVGDHSQRVRGFLALNPFTPPAALEVLASDADETVRGLVQWKELAASS